MDVIKKLKEFFGHPIAQRVVNTIFEAGINLASGCDAEVKVGDFKLILRKTRTEDPEGEVEVKIKKEG